MNNRVCDFAYQKSGSYSLTLVTEMPIFLESVDDTVCCYLETIKKYHRDYIKQCTALKTITGNKSVLDDWLKSKVQQNRCS